MCPSKSSDSIVLLFWENNGSYLADDSYKKPMIIYEYPKQLKPFYSRLQEDGNTVSAFDIVVPKVNNIFPIEKEFFSIQVQRHGFSIEC